MLKTELKLILRCFIWWVLPLAFVAWTGSLNDTGDPNFGLDFFPLELLREICSLGDWGRAVVQQVNTFESFFLSLLVAILASILLSIEHRHQDVLWSTPYSGTLKRSLLRLTLLSTWFSFLVFLGNSISFFSKNARENLLSVGWQYIPVYAVLVWLQIAIWVSLTMLFFELTHSRAWTSFAVFATQALWFWSSMFGTSRGSFAQLLHRNLITWNFLSAFDPVGLIPPAFFLQIVMTGGAVLTLVALTHLWRRRHPQWKGTPARSIQLVGVISLVILSGTAAAIFHQLALRVAPFSVQELWEGKAKFDRFYIWSGDFRLLAHPEPYLTLFLPPDSSLPEWLSNPRTEEKLRRYEELGDISIEGHRGGVHSVVPRTVVMAWDKPYPPDFERVVSRYWQYIQPVLERARACFGLVLQKLIAIWPEEGLWGTLILLPTGDLGVTLSRISWTKQKGAQWDAARALTASWTPDRLASAYAQLFLMLPFDEEGVRQALRWLEERSKGSDPGPMRRRPSFFADMFTPEEAAQVLQHWKRGEEIGHEAYIHMLLKEGQGD